MNCALSFDIASHLADRVLWWDRNHHVDVIRHEVTLFDSAFLLPSQPVEHLSQMRLQFPVKRLPAVLGNECDVIFAVPFEWLGLS
jgi:hypothetical protein